MEPMAPAKRNSAASCANDCLTLELAEPWHDTCTPTCEGRQQSFQLQISRVHQCPDFIRPACSSLSRSLPTRAISRDKILNLVILTACDEAAVGLADIPFVTPWWYPCRLPFTCNSLGFVPLGPRNAADGLEARPSGGLLSMGLADPQRQGTQSRRRVLGR